MADNGPILITEAAGRLGAVGRTVTSLLLARGLPVRAMVRHEDDRAAALRAAGAEVVVGDLFRNALATGTNLVGEYSEQLLDTRAGLATSLNLQDKFVEAETLFRDSLVIGQKKLGPEHPYVANDMYRLAFLLERQRRFDEAEELDSQCVAIRRKILRIDHPLFDEALTALGRVTYDENKRAEAATALHELLEIRRKHFGENDSRVTEIVEALAVIEGK